MSKKTKQELIEMSTSELDGYMDKLVQANKEETPEFELAYGVWETMNDQKDN